MVSKISTSNAEITTSPLTPRRQSDRRKYQRRYLKIPVQYLLSDNSEQHGSLSDISAGGMRIQTHYLPKLNEKVICYIDHLGRYEGVVIRLEQEHFAVKMSLSKQKQERFELSLMRYFQMYAPNAKISDRRLAEQDRRKAERYVNHVNDIIVGQTAQGTPFQCRVRNISLTGIEIETNAELTLGEDLKIGMFAGKIIRNTKKGYAIEKPQETA